MSASNHRYWLVIDRLRQPDALKTLYERLTQPQVACLYDQTEYAPLREQSPLIVTLHGTGAGELLADYRAGQLWPDAALLVEGPLSDEELMSQLRSLVTVNLPDRLPSLFRFYSPGVMTRLRPALTESEVSRLLGPATAWTWFDESQRVQMVNPAPRTDQTETVTLSLETRHLDALGKSPRKETAAA